MAPTNRLIEARRAELRAEATAGKQRRAKAAAATSSAKQQARPPKSRSKSKA